MDRTSWIVVILCTLGLVGWFGWYSNLPRSAPPRPVVEAAVASEKPAAAAEGATAEEAPATPAEAPEQRVMVEKDGLKVEFTSRGGGIKSLTIPAHEDFSGYQPMVLNEYGRGPVGALSRGLGDVEEASYELKSGAGELPVVFERRTPAGVVIRKSWTPVDHPASRAFLWKLDVTFTNAGAEKAVDAYSLYTGAVHPLRRNDQIPAGSVWNADGEAGWDGEGIVFDGKPEPRLERNFQQLLWAGVRSQYYTTLVAHTQPLAQLPPGRLWAERHAIDFARHQEGEGEVFGADAAVGLPQLDLAPGGQVTHAMEVYIGPRARSIFSELDDRQGANRRFAEVMFYGWWGMVSRPMLWLLTVFQGWMSGLQSSWGLAVILLTLVVRGLMWPLTIKSTRQMKRMSLLAPQMKELQEKHKEEPQRMNAEVMKLYKRYGVNPLSGCLPVLIQIPIFFGLYRMLQSAVELRGHGIWWVDDLSMPDTEGFLPHWLPWFFSGMPVNPLPLVMAGTMFVQMLMTPKSPDPNMQQQQKILLIMPFFFLFICYDFAAALALYWTISNIVGIGQTWIMKKIPDPELRERPEGGGPGQPVLAGGPRPTGGKGGKPSFMEIFAQRLAEQQQKQNVKNEERSRRQQQPRTGGGQRRRRN